MWIIRSLGANLIDETLSLKPTECTFKDEDFLIFHSKKCDLSQTKV